jgi:hypothetical protein
VGRTALLLKMNFEPREYNERADLNIGYSMEEAYTYGKRALKVD